MTTLFAHRLNRDASFDSICTTCFETVASEDNESKLTAHEERHLCDVFTLSRLDSWEKTAAQAPRRRTAQSMETA